VAWKGFIEGYWRVPDQVSIRQTHLGCEPNPRGPGSALSLATLGIHCEDSLRLGRVRRTCSEKKSNHLEGSCARTALGYYWTIRLKGRSPKSANPTFCLIGDAHFLALSYMPILEVWPPSQSAETAFLPVVRALLPWSATIDCTGSYASIYAARIKKCGLAHLPPTGNFCVGPYSLLLAVHIHLSTRQ
jgi:hypothetical protein